MFDDVDYRVRVTQIDSLINIIGISSVLSELRDTDSTSVDLMPATGIGKARGTVGFFQLEFMHTMVWQNYSSRMYGFCTRIKNATHYGVDQVFAAALREWRAAVQVREPGELCLLLKPRPCSHAGHASDPLLLFYVLRSPCCCNWCRDGRLLRSKLSNIIIDWLSSPRLQPSPSDCGGGGVVIPHVYFWNSIFFSLWISWNRFRLLLG